MDHNVQALQKFGGARVRGKALCVVRCDAAAEITEAVKCLRMGLRLILSTTLKAGFRHALRPRSIKHFCVAKSILQPVPVHSHDTEETKSFKEGLTAYKAANNGEPFAVFQIPLGALVCFQPAKLQVP